MIDLGTEQKRISTVRQTIDRTYLDENSANNIVKVFVISRQFIPSTASRALTMFKLLKNSKMQFTVFSQHVLNNNWMYSKESKLYAKNIDQNVSIDEFGWEDYVVQSFIRMNDIVEFDFLLTCIMPPYDHKIGLMIKERIPGVKWAALWSDPVAFSPYSDLAGDAENPNEIKKKEYERQVFREADILLFTNKYQMEYMLGEDYDQYIHKCVVIHHGFDSEYYPKNITSIDDGYIRCAYIGHLDEQRTIYELANGVRDCKYRDKFRIKIIGHLPVNQIKYLEDNGLSGIFDYVGELSWEDCLIEMKKCQFLITIDPKYKKMDYTQNMSSKIADYLGSYKPILFMSYNKGVSADIAKETNNKLISNDHVNITQAFNEIVMYGLWKPDYASYNKYNVKVLASVLDEEFCKRM